MKCQWCKKEFTKTKWNQKFHPLPMPCKNQAENAQKLKHAKALRKTIQQVIEGRLSIHALKRTSYTDDKIIRAAFKKAGFLY